MDLNTAANILSQQPSDILFDAGDVLVHKLGDGRILIQKGEHCFLKELEISSSEVHN